MTKPNSNFWIYQNLISNGMTKIRESLLTTTFLMSKIKDY